ncbi:hypothetical protein EB796_013323 [Bugula neritina]|uniref:NHR domain-containing protein n=1 Tax=Bugula neritina TaxID=10212 RepID=A0A7J7JR70_BUGNE|nr:hypothetical protein EB796_013323 [Bugula neritina]
MSDLSPPGTYILSGCSIVQDGYMMRTRYNCDLEQIETGSRIGMLVSSDRCLHFYLNGVDQGVACSDIPDNVYGVIDLYGACAGVSITGSTAPSDSQSPASIVTVPTTQQLNEQKAASAHRHRFSKCCGRNILLRNENTTATRTKNFDHGIVYSADPVKTDELFEIRIDQVARQWSGSLVMGFTTQTVSESQTIAITQATALDLHSSTKKTWLISGSTVTHNGEIITENYLPSLDRLEVGCKVGIKRCSDGTMHLYVNGEDLGVAARHIPRNVFLIVDIYGSVESVSITSKTKNSRLQNESHVINETLPVKPAFHTNEEGYDVDTRAKSYSFFTCVGRNIQLRNKDTVACRVNGYNQAVVLVSKPLTACSPFIVSICCNFTIFS